MVHASLVISSLAIGFLLQAAEQAPAWTTVKSAEGDFSFSLPSPPREQTKEVPSPSGKLEQKIYFCRTGGSLFVAQQIRYPAPIPAHDTASRLAVEKKGYFQAKVELVAEGAIVVDSVSGEEFTFKAPSPRGDGTVTNKIRHFFKGPFYYTLTVMSPPNQPLPAEADRFLASMSLSGEPKPFLATPDTMPSRSGKGASKGVAPPALADATPEDALRTFMVALVAHDEATLRAITLPAPDFEWILKGEAPPPEAMNQIREEFAKQPIKRLKQGDRVTLPRGQVSVVGANEVGEDRALLLPAGAPMPTRLQKVSGHWKVSAEPIIAARKAAEAAQRKAESQKPGPNP